MHSYKEEGFSMCRIAALFSALLFTMSFAVGNFAFACDGKDCAKHGKHGSKKCDSKNCEHKDAKCKHKDCKDGKCKHHHGKHDGKHDDQKPKSDESAAVNEKASNTEPTEAAHH
jgi:hypothetical protein